MNDKKEPVGGKTKKNLWTDKDKIKFIDKLAKGKIPIKDIASALRKKKYRR